MAHWSLEIPYLNPFETHLRPQLAHFSPKLTHLSPKSAHFSPELAPFSRKWAHLSPPLAHMNPKYPFILLSEKVLFEMVGDELGTSIFFTYFSWLTSTSEGGESIFGRK